MDKMSIGKDITKVYKIKPKKSMSSDMEEKSEMEEGSDPAAMLREAADMIDEGNIEDAYGIIDEAVEMCKEMHGSDGEEEYD